MQKKSNSIFINILAVCSIVMIYFQLSEHYWLVKLLKGYSVNTLLPILVIFILFFIRELVCQSTTKVKKREIYSTIIPVFCYVFFAMISIFMNESESGNVKSYLIYIYSPVIIYLSILWIWIYKRNENIIFLLRCLFSAGVIFSIYVVNVYLINPGSLSDLPVITNSRGSVVAADTGATFGIGSLDAAIRYTIPGISSTTYGPMLVPLIFIGLYFRKNATGKLKLFYTVSTLLLIYCLFKTVSRGPLIVLMAGMVYLLKWKWFNFKEIIFAVIALVLSMFTFAKMTFLRLLVTFASYFSVKVIYSGYDLSNTAEDIRLISMRETISFIGQHPFLGMGMTNLINLQNVSLSEGKEHNNYLSIGASFGIPAGIFYITFIIMLFIMLDKRIKRTFDNILFKDMGIALGAGLLALILYLNMAPAEFHFIWVWFGLVAVWIRNWEDNLSKNV